MNAPLTTPLPSLKHRPHNNKKPNACVNTKMDGREKENKNKGFRSRLFGNASFTKWGAEEVLGVGRHHPIPCLFAASLLMFMAVEYTLSMIPPSSQPFDLGFVATRHLHRVLESNPNLNTLLAGLNTVFVGMQTGYILWTWVVEGRPRATISALFMFTCRGILGYSTQLPLPEGFLGSGADFPVGNVSFFLFYSGHVAASVIASLDMRRMQRWDLARTFDALNGMQVLRLLATRGHYTIDLAVGVGAGILFDSLAGKYEESKKKATIISITNGGLFASAKKPVDSPIWDALNVSLKSAEKGVGRDGKGVRGLPLFCSISVILVSILICIQMV